jgi:putative polyhydroxyalkanoate system protein
MTRARRSDVPETSTTESAMASLNMVRPHGGSSLEEGKARVEGLLEKMKGKLEQHIDSIAWNADRTQATLKGRHVNGTFRVDEKNVSVDLKLSMAASLIKGKIESRIDQALQESR